MSLLSEAGNQQGRLIGKLETLGFDLRNEVFLDTLRLDVIKSSEIEGEFCSAVICNPAESSTGFNT